MRPSEFGQLIGAMIVQISEKDFPGIQERIGRDQTATRANLPLAMAWVCQVKLEHLLDPGEAPEAIRAMLAFVMKHVMQITGWAYPTMRTVLENRLDGYDAASSAEGGPPVPNVTKYFVACCEDLREKVRYDEIIPAPDELQSLGDELNQDALAEFRRLRRDRHCPTYTLDALKIFMVGISIFSIGKGVEAAVAKHW